MLLNSPEHLQSTTPLLECKTASIEVGALQPEEQELANQAGPLLSRMANTEELLDVTARMRLLGVLVER